MEQNPNNLPKENDPVLDEFRRFVHRMECTKDEDLRTRLDHAIDGMASEGGELLTEMKAVKFYGKKVPRIRFLDEMADDLHYLVMAMNILGVTFEDLIRLNKLKIRKRYKNGFTTEDAINRDRDQEQIEMNKAVENPEETI